MTDSRVPAEKQTAVPRRRAVQDGQTDSQAQNTEHDAALAILSAEGHSLSRADVNLILLMRKTIRWGLAELEIKGGRPVFARVLRIDYKLD